jgi:hypothetical protein
MNVSLLKWKVQLEICDQREDRLKAKLGFELYSTGRRDAERKM